MTLAFVLGLAAGIALLVAGFLIHESTCSPSIAMPFEPGPCDETVGFATALLGAFLSLAFLCATVISVYRPSYFATRGQTAE